MVRISAWENATLGRRPPTSAYKPSERPLHEWLCVFLDAYAVSDDQLVEVPRKQLFERSPREVSIREGQPDIERNTAMRRRNARQFEQRIANVLALHDGMILDQIIQDDRSRLFMKENDFLDEWVAFESELVKVVRPALRRHISQSAGEWQVPFLQRKWGGSRRP